MGFKAGVAQLVEQRIRNAKVTSSIPVTGTKEKQKTERAWHLPGPFSFTPRLSRP
jgi:hypothetical protein